MSRMNRSERIGIAAVATVALISGGVAYAVGNASAASPTQQEALAGLDAARAYVEQHPNAPLPTATPTATPTLTAMPTVTGTVAPSLTPSNFRAVAGDTKIVLTWAKPVDGVPSGYAYGRNGTDSGGFGPYASPLVTALTATLDKLTNGVQYQVFVEAVYPSGNQRLALTVIPGLATPTATPTATSTATPMATPTVMPTSGVRLSGMPWNSGVWGSGERVPTERFQSIARGGRPLDNILIYTWRNTMASQNNPAAWRADMPTTFDPVRQDLVLAVTTWTSDGASMTAAQAAAIGASLCTIDSTPIVRLDWEMNLSDGAGVNGATLTGANYGAWVARFRTAATAIKTACSATRIDFNPNHGSDQTAGCSAAPQCSRRAFQALKDVVDIFGIDRYDSYPAVTAGNSGWNSHLNGFNELDESRTYALANGKKWSLPEWGVACNGSGCQWAGNAGGDDPKYIQNYIAYLAAHASDVAYETYFNEPATYIVSDLVDANPSSRAAYRAAVLAQ